ncbi:MAG TPA: glycosyltransferase family 2 protein [Opitutaceae bacterium]|nr:glycosyltransferase family 2 protein [Opitutaceae bacterium]HND62134.1 glycosyltransferase family 2 protein [Opitutaceae bacterium]
MRASFVIPLYNCLPLTQAMVASLQASLPADLSHEIILVDDGSTDGTREWLRTLDPARGFVVVFNERNLGYAGANNRGAALARGEFLGLLNNDLELSRGWLEPMLAVHGRLGASAGLVGNIQYNFRTGEVDHAGIYIDHRGKPAHLTSLPLLRRLYASDAWRPADAVTGACTLVRRELFVRLGGFDEGFANGGEDVDFCLRARAAGHVTALALRSAVRHHVSASPGRKLRDEQNSRRLTLRWRDELARLAARSSWCGHYLESRWTSPHDPADYDLAAQALAYELHLRRTPPPAAYAAMQSAIAHEIDRWNQLLGAAA